MRARERERERERARERESEREEREVPIPNDKVDVAANNLWSSAAERRREVQRRHALWDVTAIDDAGQDAFGHEATSRSQKRECGIDWHSTSDMYACNQGNRTIGSPRTRRRREGHAEAMRPNGREAVRRCDGHVTLDVPLD